MLGNPMLSETGTCKIFHLINLGTLKCLIEYFFRESAIIF